MLNKQFFILKDIFFPNQSTPNVLKGYHKYLVTEKDYDLDTIPDSIYNSLFGVYCGWYEELNKNK